jgi:hypothetical protein
MKYISHTVCVRIAYSRALVYVLACMTILYDAATVDTGHTTSSL